MAALIGVDLDQALAVTGARKELGGRLEVANVNAPGQVVLAGGSDDIEWLVESGSGFGIRRVVPLNVAGAFHSQFMIPARDELRAAVETIEMSAPRFPVWSNTTARPHESHVIGDLLARQMVEPVLFSDSLLDMSAAGIDTFLHIGPGDVTAGLARRTVEGAAVERISSIGDIRSALDAVVTMDEH
jgi:[acyl-carrier-protein] S-malonyltransferase